MQHYYVRFGGGRLTPAIKFLILINTFFFFAALFVYGVYRIELARLFGLVPVLISQNYFWWQFVTYMFLHGGLFHLIFNMLVLWMFGCDLERIWGSSQMLLYYFICGVGAGVFNFLFSQHSMIPIVGASGAIYGILTAYAIFFGHRELYVFFMFPIRANILVIMLGLIEVFSSIFYTQSGIAHLAHLGGIVVGFTYISLRYNRGWTDVLRAWERYKRRQNFRNTHHSDDSW